MSRKVFVNLPVKDLDRAVTFFEQLGFEFDPRFTDESATCMIISDQAYAMLLVEDRFRDFTPKALCDAAGQTEAIVALTAGSREEVDDLYHRALAGGAKPAADTQDLGFMYGRSFQDVDGHLWEFFWMDPSAVAGDA
jgi:predicted lactoylglutathione lyase